MCKPQLSLLNKFRFPFLQYIHTGAVVLYTVYSCGEREGTERERGRQGEKVRLTGENKRTEKTYI